MTPEERSLLERTYKMAEENNDILKSIRRANRLSLAFRVLYWVVILGVSYGAYYFIQPYLQSMLGLYDQVRGNVDTVQSLTSKFGDFLK
jgi:uncharacterized protein (UPF0333 family)